LQVNSVCVIGLGTTGSALARRLLDRQLEVTVYDRDPWKVAAMAEAGARPARIPADAAEAADMAFVQVTDEAAAEEVLFDCGGVGDTLPDGGIVVISPSAGSAFLRSAASRLGALGLNMIEAWFTADSRSPGDVGSPPAAVLVGCTSLELETVAPLLGAVGGDVLRTGPVGSVAALRRLVAALSAVPLTGFTRGGAGPSRTVLDPRQVLQVLADGAPRRPAEGPRTNGWPGPERMELADAVAGVWVAVRDALLDGVELTSVERTEAALFPGSVNGRARRGNGVPLGSRGGPFALEELTAAMDAVRGRDHPAPEGPSGGADGGARDANCLGLEPGLFESVVAEVERRCHIPLLNEALRCSTPAELVALVNIQLTSGV
jgi:3-hydroxyisobutyrate dehydrogenase-like beta-hydroxyacid dehydrogenase